MSRDTLPPHVLGVPHVNESLAVDSGWSTVPPAPTRVAVGATTRLVEGDDSPPSGVEVVSSRSNSEDEAAGTVEPSRLQRLPKRRADGTLLGVAPPQRSGPTRPKGRNAVVVHSGVAPPEAASLSAGGASSRGQEPPIIQELMDAARNGPPADPAPPSQPATLIEAPPLPVAAKPAPVPPGVPAMPPAPEGAAIALSGPKVADDEVPVSPGRLYDFKALVAPQVTVTHREIAPPSLGEALASRVRFAGAERSLWGVLAPVVGLLVAGAAAVAVAGTWRLRAAHSADGPRTLAVAASSLTQPALSPATQPATPDITALQAKTPDSLSADEVLTMASVASERERRAAKLFREKLSRDPSAWKDRGASAELRKLVADPNTAQEALAAITDVPGSIGADLLYEVWTATPNRTDATELARALLYSRDVRAKASDALSVALELRLAETCAANSELLSRALQVGDRRSLPLLLKLKRKQGCGPSKKQDCYSCLRDGKELDAAITASKARRAPNPFVPR